LNRRVARPFRFGISVRSATSRGEWQDKARKIEALGYSTLVMPDHLTAIPPPLLPLLSAAEATSTLRVGTFVLNNDLRHPALVARDAAALDLLTDGRFELGLGAGYRRSEYDEIGIPYSSDRGRVERLSEAVAIVKRLLSGEEVTFEGSHYRLNAHRVHPVPRQRPPLLIGGNGRRLLMLAAREADIVSFLGFSFRAGGTHTDFSAFTDAGAAARVDLVRETARDRFGELELNTVIQHVAVTDNARAAAEELAADGWPLAPDELLRSPFMLVGSVPSIADALRERRERHGFSYVVVGERDLDAFAPVVSALAGS
jgi:probable F420-dependent oxidoreductase